MTTTYDIPDLNFILMQHSYHDLGTLQLLANLF
jgi:hypothetical protein